MSNDKTSRPDQGAVPKEIADATLAQFVERTPAEKAKDAREAEILAKHGANLFDGLANALAAIDYGMLVTSPDLSDEQRQEMQRELGLAAYNLKRAREELGWQDIDASVHCQRETH